MVYCESYYRRKSYYEDSRGLHNGNGHHFGGSGYDYYGYPEINRWDFSEEYSESPEGQIIYNRAVQTPFVSSRARIAFTNRKAEIPDTEVAAEEDDTEIEGMPKPAIMKPRTKAELFEAKNSDVSDTEVVADEEKDSDPELDRFVEEEERKKKQKAVPTSSWTSSPTNGNTKIQFSFNNFKDFFKMPSYLWDFPKLWKNQPHQHRYQY
jgi:hypothetical protein